MKTISLNTPLLLLQISESLFPRIFISHFGHPPSNFTQDSCNNRPLEYLKLKGNSQHFQVFFSLQCLLMRETASLDLYTHHLITKACADSVSQTQNIEEKCQILQVNLM